MSWHWVCREKQRRIWFSLANIFHKAGFSADAVTLYQVRLLIFLLPSCWSFMSSNLYHTSIFHGRNNWWFMKFIFSYVFFLQNHFLLRFWSNVIQLVLSELDQALVHLALGDALTLMLNRTDAIREYEIAHAMDPSLKAIYKVFILQQISNCCPLSDALP